MDRSNETEVDGRERWEKSLVRLVYAPVKLLLKTKLSRRRRLRNLWFHFFSSPVAKDDSNEGESKLWDESKFEQEPPVRRSTKTWILLLVEPDLLS